MAEAALESATQHFMNGDFERALAGFDEALKLVAPEQQAVVHANRGAAMMSLGNVEGAVQAFDEALKVDPDHLESVLNKAVALSELGKYEEALAGFQKACSKAPEFVPGQCGLSETLAHLGRFEESLEAAQKAVSLEATNFTAHCDKAYALLKLRRFEESVAAYEEAVKNGDDSAETKRLFAIALAEAALNEEERGNKQKAADLLAKSNTLTPSARNLHNRGIILFQLSKLDDAIASFKAALELDADYFESHAALGVLFAQSEKLDDALKHLERACAIDYKRSTEIRYNLGVVRLKKGDIEGARNEWLAVLELEPGEPNATEALRILDAALAEAKAKGSDGKAETKAATQKINEMSAAPAAEPAQPQASSGARLEVGPDGKPRGMTADQADNLIQTLDRLDAALGGGAPAAAAKAGNRRKSVLEAPSTSKPLPDERSFIRDLSAPPPLRKAAPRDNLGALEEKLTSALSKLAVEPDAVERRKSYSIMARGPGTLVPERPKVAYLSPDEVTFTYNELKGAGKIPDGADPSRKEEYLSAEEFQKLFKLTKGEFSALPMWKKIREKKRVLLF